MFQKIHHVAFNVDDMEKTIDSLKLKNVFCEPIRVDEFTGSVLLSSRIQTTCQSKL